MALHKVNEGSYVNTFGTVADPGTNGNRDIICIEMNRKKHRRTYGEFSSHHLQYVKSLFGMNKDRKNVNFFYRSLSNVKYRN